MITMKYKRFVWLAALIFILSVFNVYSQEILVVDNTIFNRPQRPAAVFDHDDHNEKAQLEEDCSICHHVYDENNVRIEDESSEDSLCSECHSLKKIPENSIPLRMAFHNRCKQCHFKSDKGPVLCGECHIRK
ncbi:MAG: cytochrome c3 family protein [Desulfobacteraceae bacterium]|nr:cytochrome c3 family protein [Desulfobacteraceae bacterium]